MHRKAHVICFIDYDPDELRRCEKNLEPHFVVATGTSILTAIEDLKKKGFEKPDLFLLDLYYPEGATSNPTELRDLAAAGRVSASTGEISLRLSLPKAVIARGLSVGKRHPETISNWLCIFYSQGNS